MTLITGNILEMPVKFYIYPSLTLHLHLFLSRTRAFLLPRNFPLSRVPFSIAQNDHQYLAPDISGDIRFRPQ